MSTPSAETRLHCPQCGAQLPRAGVPCWLCGAEQAKPVADSHSFQSAAPIAAARSHEGLSYSLSTLMLIMTLAAVACALVVALPGLGIPICILLVPVLIRTAMVVRRREESGRPVSAGEKIALVLISLVVANVIAAVVAVAAIGSFCFVCLSAGTEAAIPVAILGAAIVTIPVLVLLTRWIRSRYRRDIGLG
jgi:hypothetical protein